MRIPVNDLKNYVKINHNEVLRHKTLFHRVLYWTLAHFALLELDAILTQTDLLNIYEKLLYRDYTILLDSSYNETSGNCKQTCLLKTQRSLKHVYPY